MVDREIQMLAFAAISKKFFLDWADGSTLVGLASARRVGIDLPALVGSVAFIDSCINIKKKPIKNVPEWAFDTLACPATSYECEQAFSSGKRLILLDRNALDDDLIEALKCLKAWWDNGLVQRH